MKACLHAGQQITWPPPLPFPSDHSGAAITSHATAVWGAQRKDGITTFSAPHPTHRVLRGNTAWLVSGQLSWQISQKYVWNDLRIFKKTSVTCCTNMGAMTISEAFLFHMQMLIRVQLMSVLVIDILLNIQTTNQVIGWNKCFSSLKELLQS